MDEAYDKAEKDFSTRFKGIRPGSSIEGDSYMQEGLRRIGEDRARETSALAADLDYRRESDWLTRRTQNISTALNLDQQTFADYVSLAQMDETRLANNLAISLGDSKAFKDIFGNLGTMFAQRGLNIDHPDSVIQRLMNK
jgi:hypothetical protein